MLLYCRAAPVTANTADSAVILLPFLANPRRGEGERFYEAADVEPRPQSIATITSDALMTA